MKLNEMLLFMKFHWNFIEKKGPLNEITSLSTMCSKKKKNWSVFPPSVCEINKKTFHGRIYGTVNIFAQVE